MSYADGPHEYESKKTNRDESDPGQQLKEVHSANSWESADLGDKSRNDKFLRLMGASKKEHHGRFVIGDQNPAQKRQSAKHLNEDLEEQYHHSMEHRIAGGRKGHLGLGCHSDDDKVNKDDGSKEFVKPNDHEDNRQQVHHQVHSANSWESADLGDQSRNDKFLRLMGASKKEHHGRFVIGDQNPSQKRQSAKHLNEDLEDQYHHSMEHRIAGGWKGHLGLGCHSDDDKFNKNNGLKNFVKSNDDEGRSDNERQCNNAEKHSRDDSIDRKRESTDKNMCVEEKKLKLGE